MCPHRSRSSAPSLRWREWPGERISGGHTSVGAMPRSYEVTPKVLGWRRATRLKPVRPNRSTGVKRVSPPPSESQTDEPDDTDRRPSGSHRGVTGPCVLAVSRGCFIAAPIATSGAVTGVGDRINTHVPSSRRQPRWPAIGWTPLVLWNTQKRLSGPVHRRRWMPMRSGAAEGVGDAPRPAPVQIDHRGRRGPFSSL